MGLNILLQGQLQQFIEGLVAEIRATYEQERQSCSAPGLYSYQKNIPVGFIKAKDIHDKDLDGVRKRLSVDEWSITCA
jgi:hypothetical protein